MGLATWGLRSKKNIETPSIEFIQSGAKVALAKSLVSVQEGLPLRSSPKLESAVHWNSSESMPIHRWFRYREGFSPELFQYYAGSRYRLDPFCGCGTTLLESAMSRINSYGVDINPLATFVTHTKTAHYTKTDIVKFVCEAKTIANCASKYEVADAPTYPLLTKLFQPDSLNILLRLKTGIDVIKSPRVNNLLKLAWISILERSSNVFKEGNGLKYRNKKRQPGSYLTVPDSVWIPQYFGENIAEFVLNLWKEKCIQIAEDLSKFSIPKSAEPHVRTGSCMDSKVLDFDQTVDLCIFSPPYANRFDYFESFKMELWMGGFVKSMEELSDLRHASMRNNLGADRSAPINEWEPLTPFLDVMDPESSSVHMGIQKTLYGYFDDTRTLLQNLRSIVSTRGKIVIVVGNSAYAKSIIPTDALVARISEEEGYIVKSVDVARHLHVSSQQRSKLEGLTNFMRESVVVLENPQCTSSR